MYVCQKAWLVLLLKHDLFNFLKLETSLISCAFLCVHSLSHKFLIEQLAAEMIWFHLIQIFVLFIIYYIY